MDDLRKENNFLRQENESLKDELRKLQKKYDNLLDLVDSTTEEESERDTLVEQLKCKIIEQNKIIQITERQCELSTKKSDLHSSMVNYQKNKADKHTRAPAAHKQQTQEFWDKYRKMFVDYKAEGKTQIEALNKIRTIIKKDHQKSYHRSTLIRQLVSK